MKKYLLLITFVLSIIVFNKLSFDVSAQTKTPTPSPTPEITSEQKEADTIEKIKDLVASKVAELKLVDKRGVIGTVKRTSGSLIVLEDNKNDMRSIDIDELTKFVSSKDSFGISDIKEGNRISVIGLYNKDSKRLLARFISLASNIPFDVDGVVTEKKPKEFSLTVVDSNGTVRTINIETSTKTSLWDGKVLSKSGFSRILTGQRVIVIGFEDTKDKTIVNASRIIHSDDLPLSAALKKHQNSQGEETQVSSGSGVKVQKLSN